MWILKTSIQLPYVNCLYRHWKCFWLTIVVARIRQKSDRSQTRSTVTRACYRPASAISVRLHSWFGLSSTLCDVFVVAWHVEWRRQMCYINNSKYAGWEDRREQSSPILPRPGGIRTFPPSTITVPQCTYKKNSCSLSTSVSSALEVFLRRCAI